ncbi:MAG: type IV pilus twitching motility protein PilT [Bdellovibrionales bacterium]|nr:type IV pilus twitching motility protein PilT [Bdellovibrionales bacterium]
MSSDPLRKPPIPVSIPAPDEYTGSQPAIIRPGGGTQASAKLAVVKAPPRPSEAMMPETGIDSGSRYDMKFLVRALLKYGASDLHLKVDRPPLYRINGKLIPAKMESLGAEAIQHVIYGVLSDRQIRDLDQKLAIDFSFRMDDLGRFRCNVFHQKGTLAAVVRMIPFQIPRMEDLGVPMVLKEMIQRKRGLILVTGATGSGKSTTLASMLNFINQNSSVHVICIEDPIEFVFRDQKASITQRELGSDVHSLEEALKDGLRQDPDVIVVGELRNMQMIQTALTAAETGHLVMSTLHTNSAKSTVERIVDVFPPDAKNQVRIQLASTLVGVVSQQLLVRADGSGRVPACEVLINSPTIESYIFKNEIERIDEAIEQSKSYYKMQSLNQDLERLVKAGTVTLEEALRVSYNPDNLKLRLSGVTREEGY